MAQEAEKPLESVDQENYDNDKAGETKLSKISNGKDEEALLIDKICLNNIINNLKEREKQIILLRYYRGKTQSEVAKMLRCNSSTNIQNRKKNITRNEKTALDTTSRISREGDLDFSMAATDLKLLEYVQKATYSTASKLYSTSLLEVTVSSTVVE